MKKTMIKGLAILLIVCQLAACPALAAGSVAYGEKNEEIVTMQKRLKELGYFAGECTGFFGEFTKTAIENFQKANGLVVNGEADVETLAAMEKDNAVTKKQYIENSQKGESIEITLQTGDTGKNVRKLQEYLIRLGYLKQVITETYDAGTEYAVRFFQLVNRLKVTGVADPGTLNRLTSSSAISAEGYEEKYRLKFGDQGSDVKTLQRYLKELGYFSGDNTAQFGKKTQEAVLMFQRFNGLEETGECDLTMRLMLLAGQCVSRYMADQAEAEKELKKDDDCEAVQLLKRQLAELGFYSGETTGTTFTDALEAAVKLFQTANGLTATGIADADTRRMINAGDCVDMSAYTDAMSACALRQGDKGYAVQLLQARLKALGYYDGKVSGEYDKATVTAVTFFQRGHELEETGEADEETRARMNASDALSYEVARSRYFERKEAQKNEDKLNRLCERAIACVGSVYEAGKAGPTSYGNAGMVYACFKEIDITLEPTISLQLEYAKKQKGWNESVRQVKVGQQVFLKKGQTVLTGIYVGDSVFIYASPVEEKVIAVRSVMSTGKYEFIGSISYF